MVRMQVTGGFPFPRGQILESSSIDPEYGVLEYWWITNSEVSTRTTNRYIGRGIHST